MVKDGLTLSWGKVVTLCIAMAVTIYGTLATADQQQKKAIENVAKEVKKEIKEVADDKLDKNAFTIYKKEHRAHTERLFKQFQTQFNEVKSQTKEVQKQVEDSEKKIIRLLTIQEERRRIDGG